MATVAVGPYLRDLLSRVGESYMNFGRVPQLDVRVDETELSIDQTLLLGLIVNEATSNSYKHAFRGSEPGRVEIELRSEDGFVEVTIRDNGLGFEPPEELGAAESMGIQLMASLADQLKGTIAIDGSEGTLVALRFPILRLVP